MQIDGDVVAGVREEAVNRYLEKHHGLYAAFYSGEEDSAELDIGFTYTATTPPNCVFSTPADFTAEYRKAVLSDPLFTDVQGKKEIMAAIDAPGISISLEKVNAKFHAIANKAELATVRCTLLINAAITVEPAPPGRYRLLVTSVRIRRDNLDIKTTAATTGAGFDTKKLVEHVLNSTLTERIRQMVQAIPLPQPHLLIDHFSTHLRIAAVEDRTLIMAFGVAAIPHRATSYYEAGKQIGKLASGLEYAMFGSEIPAAKEKDAKPGTLSAKKYFTGQLKPPPRDFNELQLPVGASSPLPDGEMFVAFDKKVFDWQPERSLHLEKSETHEDDQAWHKYWFKDWIRISNPRVNLEATGFVMKADLLGGAAGGAQLTGALSRAAVELHAEARAEPDVRIDARFYSDPQGKEIWLWPRDLPYAVAVDVSMQPEYPKLKFVQDLVLTNTLALFSAVVLPTVLTLARFRLIKLPDQVPGTPVAMIPQIQMCGRWNDKIVVGVDMKL